MALNDDEALHFQIIQNTTTYYVVGTYILCNYVICAKFLNGKLKYLIFGHFDSEELYCIIVLSLFFHVKRNISCVAKNMLDSTADFQ